MDGQASRLPHTGMAIIDITWHPTTRQLRLFAVLQIAFFGLIALSVYRHTGSGTVPLVMVGISALVGMIGVAYPPFIRVIYIAWMAVLFPVGWVVSHLLLAAIFYLVFTPIGLIMRLVGRDPMHRRFDKQAKTYWLTRQSADDTRRYFKQY